MAMKFRNVEHRDFHATSSADTISYRRSGLLIAGILASVYILLLIRGKQQMVLLIIAAITALGAWFEVWFIRKAVDLLIRSGNTINRLTNPLLLGLIYIAAVTPTAVVLRLFGKDVLNLKYDRKRRTYWVPRPAGTAWKDSFKKQF